MKTAILIVLLLTPALLHAWSENPAVGFPIDTSGSIYTQNMTPKAIHVSPTEWIVFYGINQNNWKLKAQKLDANGNALFLPDGVVIDSYLWEAALIYFYQSAVADGEGGAVVVWENGPSSACRTYAQRVGATGQLVWGDGGIDVFPNLAPYFAFGAGIVRDSFNNFYVSAILQDHTKICIQKLNQQGNLLWGPEGLPALGGLTYLPPPNWNPFLIEQDQLLWVIAESGSGVRAQKVDSLGNLLWEPEGRLLFSIAQSGFYLVGIASDHRGGVWICYDYQYPGHLRVRRFDSAGNPASGEIILLPYQMSYNSDIHPDSSGGSYLVWSDSRYWPNFSIFAQRLDSLGNSLWPYAGINVSPPAASVDYTCSFSDSVGNLSAEWAKFYVWDEYVQSVNPSGHKLFAPTGTLVAKYPQVGENMWPDNNGGGLVIYTYDFEPLDWCAQRFWPSGFIGGGPTVHLVATPPESLQYVPVQGGPVSFRLQGTSWESMPLVYDLWAQAKDSADVVRQEWQMGPGPQLDTLYQPFTLDTNLVVNAGLSGGNYSLHIIAGNYPDSIWGQDSQDSIAFYKELGAYVPPAERKYGRLTFDAETGPAGTLLRYQLPQAARVRIVLFDLMGREVATLEDAWRESGSYRVEIASAVLPSGIYLCRLQAGNYQASQKIVLAK